VTDTLPHVDPHTDGFYQDPYPTYAMLRAEAPVYEIPSQPGLYFVTTWALVREALMDPGRFSNVLPPARRTEPPAEVVEEIEAIRAQGFPYTPALGTNDPPQHTRYRKMVNRAFTVRALAWMEPLVDEVADQLAAALPDDEVVDAMESITIPLPVWAIMRILGIEDQYRDDLRRWSDSSNASLGGRLSAERWLDVERDILEFQQVICGILDDRRANPRDDLLSTLVQAEEGETPLTNQELVWLVRELIVAGNETTIRALADIIVNLDDMRADVPDVWDRLRDDEAFRRGVVEEGIRLASPVMGLWRVTTCDTELGGTAIPKGSTVFLAYSSANRDDAVFDDPDAFDPLRANVKEHLAFGHGIHVCVGAGLARIEAASALRALANNVTALEVVDRDALRYGPSYGLRGLTGLPVRVHRRANGA
jgi:cytochrome P450